MTTRWNQTRSQQSSASTVHYKYSKKSVAEHRNNVVKISRNSSWRHGHSLAGYYSSDCLNFGILTIIQTRDLLQPLVIEAGKEFNSKFGNYRHSDLIGMPFGSKIGSTTGKGFIHVLRPTAELWTMALPHRTQILYIADISFIMSYLDIRRGSRVIEAG